MRVILGWRAPPQILVKTLGRGWLPAAARGCLAKKDDRTFGTKWNQSLLYINVTLTLSASPLELDSLTSG